MTVPTSHSKRASPALRALAEADPALAALSLWCVHRDGDQTGSDGSTITYGPDFDLLARHEQIGSAAHHILHVALRHSARMANLSSRMGGDFDPELYNLAADAVVNEALLQADHALPRPAVTLTGLLAETSGQDLSPQEALTAWDIDRLYLTLTRRDDAATTTRDKARAYARKQSFRPDIVAAQPGQGDPGDVADDARWRQNLSRAMQAGRQAGRGIGRLGHKILGLPEPRVPWEHILRRKLARALMVAPQPAPCRPSRRWIAGAAQAALTGAPSPGFAPGQRPVSNIPRIAVALDASGSIDDTNLALFWSEITAIARRMSAEIHLLVFDDGIRHRARIDPSQTRVSLPPLPRGGGTQFIPVVQEARDMDAAALVILTDLEGDPGPPPRGLCVIWAVPDAGARTAPYGQLIDLTLVS